MLKKQTTNQEHISSSVFHFDVGFEDVEMKGWSQQSSVSGPLVSITQQQAITDPWTNQIVDTSSFRFLKTTRIELFTLLSIMYYDMYYDSIYFV